MQGESYLHTHRAWQADGNAHLYRQCSQQPADGGAGGLGWITRDAETRQPYVDSSDGGHDPSAEDVYPDQQPDRNPEQHCDLDDRRLRGLSDYLYDELGAEEQVHDQRDVHAD